ncbi:MAG: NRDE family protein [Rhodospirillales bacterium]|nr:NRDE family protein [Rhodospirillales bacterium]
MCTLALLLRPNHRWPVIIGANRDELASRAWKPPGRHWPARPAVLGGVDLERNGTWLAVNDANVMAMLLNRPVPDPLTPGFRTRGDLPLLALDHDSAIDAASAVMQLDAGQWKPFNLVIADRNTAIWIRAQGTLTQHQFPTGLSLLANGELNAMSHARIGTYHPLFERTAAPDPDRDRWHEWAQLLGRTPVPGGAPDAGMVIPVDHRGFGTVSSTMLAIPADPGARPAWKFAPGPPDQSEFTSVATGGSGPGRRAPR